MPSYRNIVVAVDLSEHPEALIQAALSLVNQKECKVTAVTAECKVTAVTVIDYAWPGDTSNSVIASVTDTEEELVADAYERLDSILNSLHQPQPLVERNVVVGRPKQEILRLAEKEQADLIVIGAHQAHGLSGMLGSSTERVVQKAGCDVLVVHPQT